jgi:hypothetical protein
MEAWGDPLLSPRHSAGTGNLSKPELRRNELFKEDGCGAGGWAGGLFSLSGFVRCVWLWFYLQRWLCESGFIWFPSSTVAGRKETLVRNGLI